MHRSIVRKSFTRLFQIGSAGFIRNVSPVQQRNSRIWKPLLQLLIVPAILLAGSGEAFGQFPQVPMPEIAQTADLIFMGTVVEQQSRVNDAENLIVTDVRFRNEQILHRAETAVGDFGEYIEFTYAGGQVEELTLWVTESPGFRTEHRYIVFLHADGKRYFNPVIAGSDGLYQVITDSESGLRYVLNATGQGITGVRDGFFNTTRRTIAEVMDGEIRWAPSEDTLNLRTEQPPVGENDSQYAVPREIGSESPGALFTLKEFNDFILNSALTANITDPRLRFDGLGVFYTEEDGELVQHPLPEGKGYGNGDGVKMRLRELRRLQEQGKLLQPPEAMESEPPLHWTTGQRLAACGYQNLPIFMEQFNGMATPNQEGLDIWNMFMDDAYRMSSDDGTYGNNDENEFTGFISNSALDNAYNRNWDGALAKTMIWTKSSFLAGGTCKEILQTDVIHNPAYSWSDNLDPIVNDTLVYSYRTTTMHELGHTWGWQDGVDEQYNYDHPSVMHGGWRRGLVEDGWGIHAVDARAFRNSYDSQTSELEITDIGIESYYADNGLKLAMPGKVSGDTTSIYDAGDQIVIQGVTVENMSTADLDVDIEFYLSKDRFIDGSDIQIGSFHWGGLSATRYQLLGETYFSGDFTMDIPLDTPGDLYFVAMRAVPTYQTDDFTENNESSMFWRIRVRDVPNISGNVFTTASGGIEGVRILGLPDDTYTDVNGDYSAPVPNNWSGTIWPDHNKYTFVPSDASFNNVTSDQSQDFRGIVKTYDITGYVYSSLGMPLEDVDLLGFPSSETTNASGEFDVTVDHGFSGKIVPVKAGYNFTPSAEDLSSVTSDVSLFFTGVPGALANSDWPMFRKGQHHTGLLETEPVEDTEQWSALLRGDVRSSPAVDNQGNIYIAALNGVYSYDSQGDKRWEFVIDQVKHFRSSPAVGAGPVIYIGSTDGHLYAIDHEGNEKWRFATGDSIVSSPVVGNDGTVYVGSDDDSLYAVRLDGTRKWAFGTGDEIKSSPAYGPNGVVYIGSDDGKLYAVDTTGVEEWSVTTQGAVRSSPAISADGTIYFGSYDSKLYSVDPTGSVNWTYDTQGAVHSSPAIGEFGTIFFGSDDGKVYALNSDNSVAWTYQTGDAVRSSPVVGYFAYQGPGGEREIVYVGSDDGKVYAITSKNTASSQIYPGDRLWSIDTGDPVRSSPALNGDKLYVGSDDFYLHAIGGGGSASGMFAALGLGGIEGMEEIAIIIMESEEGGLFGDPAIIGGIGDGGGCTGGPLIIPDCGTEFVDPGAISGFVDIRAGVPLRIGILPASKIDRYDEVISNETTEPLIGSFTTTFEAGESFVATLSGLDDPETFQPNPDGRSTAMDLKIKTDVGARANNPATVHVLAGNFITDSENMTITLVEAEQRFSGLKYGDFSDLRSVEPGEYTVRMSTDPEGLAKGAVVREFPLDLRFHIGQTVTLFANGFLDPRANNDGPSATLVKGNTYGSSVDLGRRAVRKVISLLQLLPVFQNDYLLEPGETHPLRYTDFSDIGFGAWWAGFLLPYHSTSLGEIIREFPMEPETENVWSIPFNVTAFDPISLGDGGRFTLKGQPSDSLPELVSTQLMEHGRDDYTHISKIVWGDYEGEFGASGIRTWYIMSQENGFALPVAKYQELSWFGISQPMFLTMYDPVHLELPAEIEEGALIQLGYDLNLYEFNEDGSTELADTTSYKFTGWVESHGATSLPQPFGNRAELEETARIRIEKVQFGESGVTEKSGIVSYLNFHLTESGHELITAISGSRHTGQTRIQSGDIYSVDGVYTEVEDENGLPEVISLYPNYPNPFNPTTEIRYDLPESADVRLSVYDIRGNRVATLVHGRQTAGTHQVTFEANELSSGVYFYQLRTRDFSDTGKMMLLK